MKLRQIYKGCVIFAPQHVDHRRWVEDRRIEIVRIGKGDCHADLSSLRKAIGGLDSEVQVGIFLLNPAMVQGADQQAFGCDEIRERTSSLPRVPRRRV